jgi:hypothetical protein
MCVPESITVYVAPGMTCAELAAFREPVDSHSGE